MSGRFVPGAELLREARRGGWAVGAFNVNNLEFLQAVAEAARQERSPVIVAVTEGAIRYAGLECLVAMARAVFEGIPVPVALHLDHGRDVQVIAQCIRAGFSSVMIDASDQPFQRNAEVTRRVVEMAHLVGVSVEAELGRLRGVEDELSVEEAEAYLVDPWEARRFVELTQVDSLAPAIGTAHGAFKFKGEPRLDLERLRLTAQLTGLPLVLHGASLVPPKLVEKLQRYGGAAPGARGVPPEAIRRAIELGVAKVNVDTDLRIAFVAELRRQLAEHPERFDPRQLLGPAREAVCQAVRERMRLLGSSGRA